MKTTPNIKNQEIKKIEPNQGSDNLRQDWVECTLGELLSVSSGKGLTSKKMDGGIYPVYGGNGITGYHSEKIFSEQKLIIGRVGVRCGVTHLTQEKSWVTDNALVVSFKSSDFDLKFMKLKLEFENLNKLSNSTAQPVISGTKIYSHSISLPPLVEQKAIIKKIEELFSSLDSGIADLKKAQDQLVIYRQAVLKKAFEGEFKKVKLEDACEKATKVKRKEMDISEPLLYLDIGGIDNKTNIIFSHKEYTWENAPSRAQQIVKVGDVLFSTVRTYLKNIAQVKNPIYNDEIASSGFTIIRGKKDLLNPKFIFFIAISQFFLEPLNKLQRGTSYPAVRDKDVFSQLIPLPTLEEQHQIVSDIESRLSVCDKVEKDIADSLEKAQALRQSILKKAFEGKLLSKEEIAKCKADAAYEPASILLEKIKAEKLAKETITKKPKKKTTIKKPPAPQKISTDIQAGVISKVIQLHIDNPKYLDNLTHVKCEKISHLVEYHLQIPLGRVPVKDAAGPDDYNHLKKVEHRAGMAGYFKVVKKEIGHTYSASRNISKAIDNLETKITTVQKKQLDDLINLFLKFDLERAEIIATLYAGWNNLLIDGKTPTDDEIVYESRENWSKRKLTIKRERFYKALQWMRKDEINLIPIGFGSKVLKPNK